MGKEFFLSTGKKDFENLFIPNKGIRVDASQGTSILIEGSAGVGKTTLAIELVVNAIKNHKAKCLYYVFDQTASEIETLLKAFRWSDQVKVGAYSWRDIDKMDLEDQIYIIETRSLDDIEGQLESMKEHVKQLNHCDNKIIVIDSIGVNSDLSSLKREVFSVFLNRLKRLNTITILLREKHKNATPPISEYLTNVVLNLQVQDSAETVGPRGNVYVTTIEIKKTRNQHSLRGPHEFEIESPENSNNKRKKNYGFVIYPSLQSVAKINKNKELRTRRKDRAKFGLDLLDTLIGEESDEYGAAKKGIPYGQSILLKGPPGNYKTALGLQFLLNKSQNERVLFVSCRLDKAALQIVDLFDLRKEEEVEKKKVFFQKLEFIDARDPYRTPAMIMSSIKEAVEKNTRHKIHRAVIFGIGMLETLPMFEGNALYFLQVLLGYFRSKQICSIWVDWKLSPDPDHSRGKPLLQTQVASHLVAAELSVKKQKSKKYKTQKTLLGITRKNYRSFKKDAGYLDPMGTTLIINEIPKNDFGPPDK